MSDFRDGDREPASIREFRASSSLGHALPTATRTLEEPSKYAEFTLLETLPVAGNERLPQRGTAADPRRQRRSLSLAEPVHQYVSQALFGRSVPRQNGVAAHARRHPGHHALDLFVTQMAGADVHDVVGVSHGVGIIANMCSLSKGGL